MRLYGLVVCSAAMLSLSMHAHSQVRSEADDLVKETKVAYVANHADGAKESVIVAYQGYVYHRIWQTGSASTWNHPIDDRTCHVETKARVVRRAYYVTHSGVSAALDSYEGIYNLANYTDRGPDDKIEALTRHVTCGSVMGDFQQRVEAVKSSLIANFDKIVKSDDDPSRRRLAAMMKATSLAQTMAKAD